MKILVAVIVAAIALAFIAVGVLFARRNPKKVEQAVAAGKALGLKVESKFKK